MTDLIHVLLADDHDIVRSGLKAALRGHPSSEHFQFQFKDRP